MTDEVDLVKPPMPNSIRTSHRPVNATRLGDRVRQLRVAAGLTQTDLAGTRFSKEYISQIERGKTRPTQETIAFLAERLKIDLGYLANGVETVELARAETILAQGEALSTAGSYDEAIETFERAHAAVASTGIVELELQRVLGLTWAQMERGDVRPALDLL